MALSFGFYDSLNGDRRYTADEFSSIFDGVVNDGIYESEGDRFEVTAVGGLEIAIGTGRAWFNHTWTLNDTLYTITLPESDLTYDRYDAVVLKVDKRTAARSNSFEIIVGNNGEGIPEMPSEPEIYYYPLAYIFRGYRTTEITTADIQQAVSLGHVDYVTGILRTTDISYLFDQWEAQFKAFQDKQKEDFRVWVNTVKDLLDNDDVAQYLAKSIVETNEKVFALEERIDNIDNITLDKVYKTITNPTFTLSSDNTTLYITSSEDAVVSDVSLTNNN